MSDKVLRTLRAMAWNRAKGELMAMMHTYWNKDDQVYDQQGERAGDVIDKFIQHMEEEGLFE